MFGANDLADVIRNSYSSYSYVALASVAREPIYVQYNMNRISDSTCSTCTRLVVVKHEANSA